jgi:FtsH-binding integral membrane protein
MTYIKKYGHWAISIFISIVFLDSLRFKFTNAPETQEIFGRLNAWSASFGADGLFAQTGLFSQYVIGSAELIASTFVIAGAALGLKRLQGLGALIGLAVMTGAISFHLFTPLGIDPNNDGGGLFVAANIVWLGSAILVFLRRKDLISLGQILFAQLASKTT